MVYVLTAIFILIGIVLLLRMKVHVAAEYLHTDDNDKMTLKITTLFGLIRIKKTIPAIKVNKEDGTVDIKQKSTSKVKKSSSKKKFRLMMYSKALIKSKCFCIRSPNYGKSARLFWRICISQNSNGSQLSEFMTRQ